MRRTSFEYEEPRKSFGARLASGLRRSAVATLSLVLIPGLLIVALLLPPISLVERIQFLSYSAVDNSGGTLMDSDMTSIIFPPENVIESFRASLESIPRIEFENGAAGGELDRRPRRADPRSATQKPDLRSGRAGRQRES